MPHVASIGTFTAPVRVAEQAFSLARMTPANVDVAEVHDCFTGIALIRYEDLGFAERFGACRLPEAEDLEGLVAHGG
jgi:acetyl-CoA C-acetyltransferase